MRTIAVVITAALAAGTALPARATEPTVMSFNIWGGGANARKPGDETVAAIRAAGADIVGIQETKTEPDPCTPEDCVAKGESVAAKIAAGLGFHVYDQTAVNPALWANAIVSRYPIGRATAHDLGVPIEVDGRKVYAFNIHLTDYPYVPYQMLKITYGSAPFLKTEAEGIASSKAARGPALDLLEQDLKAADGADAVFLFGDFNEPSHRDWTAEAVKAGHQPMVLHFPSTARVEAAGFIDLFRKAYPDPGARPAFTWTPTTEPADPQDHHDRIDFVFGKGPQLDVVKAAIVGEKQPEADVVGTPWPSDHRAVTATVRF